MIEIRRASASDAAALAELRYDFRSGVTPAVEDRAAFLGRCRDWMSRELASEGWAAWLALSDGRIVGQVWVHVIEKVPNPVGERQRHGYLSNLFVVPDARGGIGTKLLEAALAWLSAQEVDRVVLWPSPLSRSLYLRYGFTPNGDVFERTL